MRDDVFVHKIIEIVDPKFALSAPEVIKLVEEKFTANNTQRDAICPKSAVLRSNHTLVCIEDGDSCTGIVGACQA